MNVKPKTKPKQISFCDAAICDMPGCCGIHVVENLKACDDSECCGNQMESVIKNGFRPEYIEKGVGLLLATTTRSQRTANKELKRTGWKPLTVFTNPKTGNRVTLWGRTRTRRDQ